MTSPWSVLGRERELAVLDRAWSDAMQRGGGLLVLDGEAGVGKTALAVALVERAAVAPVWVSCVEQTGHAPRRVLAAVVEGLGAVVTAGDQLVAVADAFARAASDVDGPVLVVIDDAQWADEVSLHVLGLAAPQLCDSPVLVVATVRTGEPLPRSKREAIVALLRAARRLPVLPLPDAAAGAVVDAAAPRG